MRLSVVIALFWLVLISCEHRTLRNLFYHSTYDQDVIQSLPLYDSLKNITLSNIDTIFKFRNSRHLVYHDASDKGVQKNADFYIFNYTYDPNSKSIDELKENIPDFIYPSVDRIFKKLGRDKISGFGLWPDSTIEITIRSFYKKEENADVSHILVWKRVFSKNTDQNLFYRDTVIAPKWTYEISVQKHSD